MMTDPDGIIETPATMLSAPSETGRAAWASRAVLQGLGRPALAIAIAALVGGLIILLLGDNPLTAYGILLSGAFGNSISIYSSLQFTTPLIFTGLAVAF